MTVFLVFTDFQGGGGRERRRFARHRAVLNVEGEGKRRGKRLARGFTPSGVDQRKKKKGRKDAILCAQKPGGRGIKKRGGKGEGLLDGLPKKKGASAPYPKVKLEKRGGKEERWGGRARWSRKITAPGWTR